MVVGSDRVPGLDPFLRSSEASPAFVRLNRPRNPQHTITKLRPHQADDADDEPRRQHDHAGLLSLPRHQQGVALAWLLVLGTGLLLMGVLVWMGTGPSPTAAVAAGGGSAGMEGPANRNDRVASPGSSTGGGVGPAIGA